MDRFDIFARFLLGHGYGKVYLHAVGVFYCFYLAQGPCHLVLTMFLDISTCAVCGSACIDRIWLFLPRVVDGPLTCMALLSPVC